MESVVLINDPPMISTLSATETRTPTSTFASAITSVSVTSPELETMRPPKPFSETTVFSMSTVLASPTTMP